MTDNLTSPLNAALVLQDDRSYVSRLLSFFRLRRVSTMSERFDQLIEQSPLQLPISDFRGRAEDFWSSIRGGGSVSIRSRSIREIVLAYVRLVLGVCVIVGGARALWLLKRHLWRWQFMARLECRRVAMASVTGSGWVTLIHQFRSTYLHVHDGGAIGNCHNCPRATGLVRLLACNACGGLLCSHCWNVRVAAGVVRCYMAGCRNTVITHGDEVLKAGYILENDSGHPVDVQGPNGFVRSRYARSEPECRSVVVPLFKVHACVTKRLNFLELRRLRVSGYLPTRVFELVEATFANYGVVFPRGWQPIGSVAREQNRLRAWISGVDTMWIDFEHEFGWGPGQGDAFLTYSARLHEREDGGVPILVSEIRTLENELNGIFRTIDIHQSVERRMRCDLLIYVLIKRYVRHDVSEVELL